MEKHKKTSREVWIKNSQIQAKREEKRAIWGMNHEGFGAGMKTHHIAMFQG
jgi:hypothetical protein